ncbi:MAG: hypothetical protein Q9209_007898 [Squamulea sp. 1 TL-2023]
MTTRLLGEHYTGLMNLSRLKLLPLGLEALSSRAGPPRELLHEADVAFALMALPHYRLRLDTDATLFQTLARLSLANDSDRIVERAVCLLQDATKQHHSAVVFDDALGVKLWDNEPLCQVAGVGEKNEIFLDGCKSANIRWKDVPRIHHDGQDTWRRRLAATGWQTAPVRLLIGVVMFAVGSDSHDGTVLGLGVLFLMVGLFMPLRLPWEIQRLHSGKTCPWLIGFESVLQIRQIEQTPFGNYIGRLIYAPSSGLSSSHSDCERLGGPPAWTEDPDLANAPKLP